MTVSFQLNNHPVTLLGVVTSRLYQDNLFIKPKIHRQVGLHVLYRCEGDGHTTGWHARPRHAYHSWEWATGRRVHCPRRGLVARRMITDRFEKHPSQLNTYVLHDGRLMQIVGYTSFTDELILRDWSR